jgi:hypothetical protein
VFGVSLNRLLSIHQIMPPSAYQHRVAFIRPDANRLPSLFNKPAPLSARFLDFDDNNNFGASDWC